MSCLIITDISDPLVDAFTTLRLMTTRFNLLHSALGNKLWEVITPIEIDRLVNPIVRMFLSPSARVDSPPLSIGACVRSGALLYLAEFRRRSGVSPVIVDVHLQNLSEAMMRLMEDYGDTTIDPSFRIWLLTIGAIEERPILSYSHEKGGFFHRWLGIELSRLGIMSLSEYKQRLSEIVWPGLLFDERLNSLVEEMSSELSISWDFRDIDLKKNPL